MAARSLLPLTWKVPEVFRERLGDQVGRQRVMVSQEHLLLVLHRPPRPDEHERAGRFMWRQPDGTWNCSDLGSGPRVLDKHLAEFADGVEKYDRQEEQASGAEQYFQVLDGLAPLHRSIRNLHQVLQEARQQCPQDRYLINARDRAYEIERRAELLYQETKNSLDFLVARQAEQQTRSSHQMAFSAHRLNLLAAFFLPLATLATLFGANLTSGLESFLPPWPLLTLLALGLLGGSILTSLAAGRGGHVGKG